MTVYMILAFAGGFVIAFLEEKYKFKMRISFLLMIILTAVLITIKAIVGSPE
ncbi:MAG: hypothetical protein JSW73_00500 [Candidatus Woesearchaeota archaeon]|nr:MAG: hypothetical protein JSW73_00500 [Candidatus Woesearchaeota archaeon]